MPLIDNKTQTLQQALKNTLQTSDKVDISVGYFYFSGFEALAEELKDKNVRVLVGMEATRHMPTGKRADLENNYGE